jgi:recombination protein RecA
MYGNPETTPGGRALKFYASVRIEVRKGEVIKEGGQIIGASTRCKVVKNKVAPPFKEAEFDMMYGEGISRTGEVLDIATELEIIKKGGSWFSYGDRKLGQGRDNVKELLKTDPELMAEIEEQILARKDELMDKDKKKNSKNTAAAAIAEVVKAAANEDDEEMKILDSIDDEFDEFTPAD